MRFSLPLLAALIAPLAACTPSVPESGQGVGFQDYGTYVRNQQPRAAAALPQPVIVPPPGFNPANVSAAIDRAEGLRPAGSSVAPVTGSNIGASGALDPNRPRGDAPANIRVEAGETVHSNPSISDEQDFSAVSSRETIESDKARIEQNRQEYVVVQPGALPQRPAGEGGPNIVAYALSTTHPVGASKYKRSGFKSSDPAAACARYGSSDRAQEAFLDKGGPDRDRLGLDPDGDGYACDWDPRPFRAAQN